MVPTSVPSLAFVASFTDPTNKLHRQQRDIINCLRDPCSLCRANDTPFPNGPDIGPVPCLRGFIHLVSVPVAQPAPKKRLLSVVIKVDNGEAKFVMLDAAMEQDLDVDGKLVLYRRQTRCHARIDPSPCDSNAPRYPDFMSSLIGPISTSITTFSPSFVSATSPPTPPPRLLLLPTVDDSLKSFKVDRAGNEYLINLIDSPGNIDFSSDVTTSLPITMVPLLLSIVLRLFVFILKLFFNKYLEREDKACVDYK